MIRTLAAALFVLVVTSTAHTQTLFERYLSGNAGTTACWARPAGARGRIDRFFISHAHARDLRPHEHFQLVFGFTLKRSADIYLSEANCDAVGPSARCSAADNAGRFTLSPEGDNLKLIIGNRLSLRGSQGVSPDLADGEDDLVIQLMPAPPEACTTETQTQ